MSTTATACARASADGLDLVAAGRIDVGALVTHRFALDEVDAAFEALVAKEPGFVKATITWAPR